MSYKSLVPEANLRIYQGEDKSLIISVVGEGGKEVITGDTLTFEVFIKGDAVPVITKSTDTPTEITISASNEITVFLLPADTSVLDIGRYFYQVWHTEQSDSKVSPVLTGYFDVVLLAPSIISSLRLLLDEAGELGTRQVNDIISPITTTEVAANRRRVVDVQGIWLLSDTAKSGTNYFTGGEFEYSSGRITLGTQLPNAISDVRISFTWESGIADDVIAEHLTRNKVWVEGISGQEFEYGATTNADEEYAENLAIAVTVLSCILTINGANVAQMGYNFKIQEFEIQTKLWGEGMIAEALFNQYRMEIKRWEQALGIDIRSAVANKLFPRYDLRRHFSHSGKYNKGATIYVEEEVDIDTL
ncbi:MAG: hypothetical protein ACXAC2_00120 [Candidatus Kariarchaeaceae archaeon]|jgi:hypothetical protein